MCVRVNRTMTITEEMVKEYASLSGDDNPIHQNQSEAERYQFQSPIAHGMLLMGFGAEVAVDLVGKPCIITDYDMHFLNPVFINDIVQLFAEKKGDSNLLEIRGYVHGELVVKGKAKYERKR